MSIVDIIKFTTEIALHTLSSFMLLYIIGLEQFIKGLCLRLLFNVMLLPSGSNIAF